MPINEELMCKIREFARTSQVEVCGIISTKNKLYTIKNVSKTPAHHFMFDKKEYFACLKQILADEAQVLCIFHTHPHGDHAPSQHDLKAYKQFKRNSLIVSTKGYTWLAYA